MKITLYKILLSLFILFSSNAIFSQTGNLRGRITEYNQPLLGVNIFLKETMTGGVSDIRGYYLIESIPAGRYTIRFSAVGFKTQEIVTEIQANRTLELNVEMELEVIEVDEVEVVDSKIQRQSDTKVSLIDLKPDKARMLPGAVTDVFRTLQALPGVLAPNDFSSQLVIRGSGPDQNLIVMDNVEILNPYRLYGVISMFNPEAVSDIELITGGFPAKYGDRLSAVLDVTNRTGNYNTSLSGNLNASIVSANLVLEGKNPFNIPGSWLINSRRTYYDLIIEPFVKNTGIVEENVSFPNFYDFQAKLAFGPFNGHKFFLNGILSRDGVDVVSTKERTNPDSIGIVDLTKNDVASAAWHFTPTKNVLNKLIFSWYRNGGDTEFDSEFLDPSLNRADFEDTSADTLAPYLLGFGFNSEYTFEKIALHDKFVYLWGKNNEFEAGVGFDRLTTLIDFEFELDPQLQAILNSNPNVRSALRNIRDEKSYTRYHSYLHNNFKISDKLYLQPGVRFDYYDILSKSYFAPRFSFSYAFNNVTTLRGVWGLYYQSPGYEKLRDQNVLFDFTPQYTQSLEAERAFHYVLSLEHWLTEEWRAKFETYVKDFDDLIVPQIVTGTKYFTEQIQGKDIRYSSGWTRPITVPGDSVTQIPINDSYGEAYGFELLVEKRNILGKNKINGWISYALAFANRYENGIKLPFRFDQRHTVNVVLDYNVNDWLDVGLRFQYGSGFPLTEAVGIKPRVLLEDNNGDLIPDSPVIALRNTSSSEGEVIYDVDFGDNQNRYSSRRPPYHRLDIRLGAKADYWDLDWTFYLDIINVYNRGNIINYDYYISKDLKLEREATTMFPILPTLGFNLKF